MAEISCADAEKNLRSALSAYSDLPLHVDECRMSANVELYVPWWAWPLELAHRAVFGPVSLSNAECTDRAPEES